MSLSFKPRQEKTSSGKRKGKTCIGIFPAANQRLFSLWDNPHLPPQLDHNVEAAKKIQAAAATPGNSPNKLPSGHKLTPPEVEKSILVTREQPSLDSIAEQAPGESPIEQVGPTEVSGLIPRQDLPKGQASGLARFHTPSLGK